MGFQLCDNIASVYNNSSLRETSGKNLQSKAKSLNNEAANKKTDRKSHLVVIIPYTVKPVLKAVERFSF